MTLYAEDAEATMRLGADLAAELLPGDVVLLHGPLGAGKTTLVRGALRALGWTGPVRSPTFNLVSEYPVAPPVVHVDLYRLEGPEDLGLEERAEGAVTFVEWPERDPSLGEGRRRWEVWIDYEGEGRRVTVAGPGD